jgi:hypothetical protein
MKRTGRGSAEQPIIWPTRRAQRELAGQHGRAALSNAGGDVFRQRRGEWIRVSESVSCPAPLRRSLPSGRSSSGGGARVRPLERATQTPAPAQRRRRQGSTLSHLSYRALRRAERIQQFVVRGQRCRGAWVEGDVARFHATSNWRSSGSKTIRKPTYAARPGPPRSSLAPRTGDPNSPPQPDITDK